MALYTPDAPFDMRGKRFLDVYLSEPTTGGADGMGLNQSEGISTGSAVGSHGGGGGLGAGVSPTSSTLWNSALSSMGYGRGGTHGSSHNASTPTTATVSRRSFSFVPNTSSSSGNSSSSSIGVGPGRAAGGRPLSGSLSPVSTSQLQQNKRHKLLFVQDDNLLIVVSALKNKLTNKNGMSRSSSNLPMVSINSCYLCFLQLNYFKLTFISIPFVYLYFVLFVLAILSFNFNPFL